MVLAAPQDLYRQLSAQEHGLHHAVTRTGVSTWLLKCSIPGQVYKRPPLRSSTLVPLITWQLRILVVLPVCSMKSDLSHWVHDYNDANCIFSRLWES